MRSVIRRLPLAVAAALLVLTGCGGGASSEESSRAANAKGVAAKEAMAHPSAEVLAALAKADLVDGVQDKTISKCYTCAFYMQGSPEHAVEVGDYEVQLCSDHCREKFSSDPAGVILAAKIPDEEPGGEQ